LIGSTLVVLLNDNVLEIKDTNNDISSTNEFTLYLIDVITLTILDFLLDDDFFNILNNVNTTPVNLPIGKYL
jgi:hypothetical protein